MNMEKLTQKQLVQEGFSTFVSNLAKGTGKLALKGGEALVRSALPKTTAAYDKLKKATKDSFKDYPLTFKNMEKFIKKDMEARGQNPTDIQFDKGKQVYVVKANDADGTPFQRPAIYSAKGNNLKLIRPPEHSVITRDPYGGKAKKVKQAPSQKDTLDRLKNTEQYY